MPSLFPSVVLADIFNSEQIQLFDHFYHFYIIPNIKAMPYCKKKKVAERISTAIKAKRKRLYKATAKDQDKLVFHIKNCYIPLKRVDEVPEDVPLRISVSINSWWLNPYVVMRKVTTTAEDSATSSTGNCTIQDSNQPDTINLSDKSVETTSDSKPVPVFEKIKSVSRMFDLTETPVLNRSDILRHQNKTKLSSVKKKIKESQSPPNKSSNLCSKDETLKEIATNKTDSAPPLPATKKARLVEVSEKKPLSLEEIRLKYRNKLNQKKQNTVKIEMPDDVLQLNFGDEEMMSEAGSPVNSVTEESLVPSPVVQESKVQLKTETVGVKKENEAQGITTPSPPMLEHIDASKDVTDQPSFTRDMKQEPPELLMETQPPPATNLPTIDDEDPPITDTYLNNFVKGICFDFYRIGVCHSTVCPYSHDAKALFEMKLSKASNRYIFRLVKIMTTYPHFADLVYAGLELISKRKVKESCERFIKLIFDMVEPDSPRFINFWKLAAQGLLPNEDLQQQFTALLKVVQNEKPGTMKKLVTLLWILKYKFNVEINFKLVRSLLWLNMPATILIEVVQNCNESMVDVNDVRDIVMPLIRLDMLPVLGVEAVLKFYNTLSLPDQREMTDIVKSRLVPIIVNLGTNIDSRRFPLTAEFQRALMLEQRQFVSSPCKVSDQRPVLKNSKIGWKGVEVCSPSSPHIDRITSPVLTHLTRRSCFGRSLSVSRENTITSPLPNHGLERQRFCRSKSVTQEFMNKSDNLSSSQFSKSSYQVLIKEDPQTHRSRSVGRELFPELSRSSLFSGSSCEDVSTTHSQPIKQDTNVNIIRSASFGNGLNIRSTLQDYSDIDNECSDMDWIKRLLQTKKYDTIRSVLNNVKINDVEYYAKSMLNIILKTHWSASNYCDIFRQILSGTCSEFTNKTISALVLNLILTMFDKEEWDNAGALLIFARECNFDLSECKILVRDNKYSVGLKLSELCFLSKDYVNCLYFLDKFHIFNEQLPGWTNHNFRAKRFLLDQIMQEMIQYGDSDITVKIFIKQYLTQKKLIHTMNLSEYVNDIVSLLLNKNDEYVVEFYTDYLSTYRHLSIENYRGLVIFCVRNQVPNVAKKLLLECSFVYRFPVILTESPVVLNILSYFLEEEVKMMLDLLLDELCNLAQPVDVVLQITFCEPELTSKNYPYLLRIIDTSHNGIKERIRRTINYLEPKVSWTFKHNQFCIDKASLSVHLNDRNKQVL